MRLPRFPDKRLSNKSARAQLTMLLLGCTDARLRDMTPDWIARTHSGVRVDEARGLLEQERQRRGV